MVAAAFTYGGLAVKHFEDEFLHAGRHLELIAKVRVIEDDECGESWPEGLLSMVDVRLRSGQVESARIEYYKGHAKNPMIDADVDRKFLAQSEGVLSEEKQTRLMDSVWSLAEADDVKPLLAATTIE